MSPYESLEKLFHSNTSSSRFEDNAHEADLRLTNPFTFRTGISIETGEVFLAMPKELTLINEKMLRVERKVSKLWSSLPGIAQGQYIRSLIVDEVVWTNEIEGIHSSRRQIESVLEKASSSPRKRDGERFIELSKLYQDLSEGKTDYPETPEDIRQIFDDVVAGELLKKDLPDGVLFRKDVVEVKDAAQRVLHTGVIPEEKIFALLSQMIALAESPEMPATYRALISHFLFEYIHPFYDGNGRTGRYLLALYLYEPLSLTTVLSLSRVIAENKTTYYKAFQTAESSLNHAEMTGFVMDLIGLIRIAQDNQIESLTQKRDALSLANSSLITLAEGPYHLSEKAVKVVYQAAQNHLFAAFPETTLEGIQRYLECGTQTARKYAQEAVDARLLQTTSQKPLRFELTAQALVALGLQPQ